MFELIRRFLQHEAASGFLLILATLLALIVANSPWQNIYEQFLSLKLTVAIEEFAISKPLLLWINDGLMAVFFLLVGLELKREALIGELNTPKKVVLPALAAVGGMIFPALIYTLINIEDDIAMQGWAIPTATDIAFSLGILILLGKKVPNTLKVFLVSLALFDDLGAIIIIAFFYTHNLSMNALLVSAACIALLWAMNRAEVVSKAAYLMVGTVMWGGLLQSGVHATLAGVILAMFIPIQGIDWEDQKTRPLHELEHDLYSPVGLIVLPLFAFANAGLSFSQLNINDVFQNIPLGIILGLFVGKQAGVMLSVWLGIKLKIGAMPKNVDWAHMYGIAVLCGVGFTMSLFIGGLAFEQSGAARVVHDRLGILLGSLLSALWAVIWLLYFCRNNKNG